MNQLQYQQACGLTPTGTRTALLATFVALALAGCASFDGPPAQPPGPATAATGLTPQAARITDGRIASDRETLNMVQQRLRKLNESGIALNNYPLAKAQCWLDTARTQYNENDRTGYIEESLGESMKIVQALEADKNAKAGYDTPLVARSTRLRDDLWAQLGQYKTQDATLACNARSVACAEVALVRAGHAEQQTGWRQATPHVQIAEDGLRRAGVEAANCAQPATQQAGVTARTAPAVVAPPPAPVIITRETFTILVDTLFRFDKSGKEDMLPGGLQRLGIVAERLKTYKSVESFTILGHTDRLGGDAFNDKLSQARADTVKAYFESMGLKAGVLIAKGMGEREPLTKGCSDKLPRAELIQCLQPDRRVTIEITGNAK
ncbi:MAG: OmpA family protein [Burkholderiaceae bacterium]|nr:OmpA family protein [Burkholderiaceae bacterium]